MPQEDNNVGGWDPLPLDAAESLWEPRIFQVCELLRSSNMDLKLFISRCLQAKTKRMKEKQRAFIDSNGIEEVFNAMLSVINCNTKRKQNSATAVMEVKRRLGNGIWRVVQQTLELELKGYCKQVDSKCPVQAITPEMATSFTFEQLGNNFRQHCPQLWRVIQVLCAVGLEEEGDRPVLTRKRKKSGLEGRGRRKRNKKLVGTVIMGIMAFARSRQCNALQTPIGYYLQASGVPKRVIGILNRLGVSIGYTTICDAMKSIGIANGELVQKRIMNGEPIGIMWDNNAMFENKTGQSVKNRQVLTQYTCAAVWFLNIPKPEEPSCNRPSDDEIMGNRDPKRLKLAPETSGSVVKASVEVEAEVGNSELRGKKSA